MPETYRLGLYKPTTDTGRFYYDATIFRCDPFEILPGLYYVGDTNVSLHLLDTGDGLLMFDAGYPHAKHLYFESIRRLGFDPKDVKLLILSHGHYDHMGIAHDIKQMYGTRLALGAPDAKMFKENPILALYNQSGCEYYTLPTIDVELHDGDVIDMGKAHIRCMATPGHTDGTFSFFFEWAGHNVGYFGGQGTNTMSTAFFETYGVPPIARTNLRNSVKHVYDIPVDVVLGNHASQADMMGKRARVLNGELDAFVDAGEWKRRMDSILRSVDALDERDPIK